MTPFLRAAPYLLAVVVAIYLVYSALHWTCPQASRGTGHGVAFDQDETKDRPRQSGLGLDICFIVSFRSLDCLVYR